MSFQGFDPTVVDFMWGIRFNNSREWFGRGGRGGCLGLSRLSALCGHGALLGLAALRGRFGTGGGFRPDPRDGIDPPQQPGVVRAPKSGV